MFNPGQNFLLVVLFTIFGSFHAEGSKRQQIDSLQSILADPSAHSLSVEQSLELYYKLSTRYNSIEDYENCIKICEEGLAFAEKKGSTLMLGDLLYQMGYAHRRLNNFGEALDYLKQVIALPRDHFQRQSIEAGYNDLALVYQAVGDYQKII